MHRCREQPAAAGLAASRLPRLPSATAPVPTADHVRTSRRDNSMTISSYVDGTPPVLVGRNCAEMNDERASGEHCAQTSLLDWRNGGAYRAPMARRVVCIARLIGAGGESVGQAVADQLGLSAGRRGDPAAGRRVEWRVGRGTCRRRAPDEGHRRADAESRHRRRCRRGDVPRSRSARSTSAREPIRSRCGR